MTALPTSSAVAELGREVARRRTFAIISHPDAGKTTLTEKLLLFGGAKVPQLARSLGLAKKEFEAATEERPELAHPTATKVEPKA